MSVSSKNFIAAAAILATTLLLYGNTLGYDFAFDDLGLVRDNPLVHRFDLIEIATSDYWAGYHSDRSGLYRPLTVLSFAALHAGGGGTPFLQHLANVLVHGANAVLLYLLFSSLANHRLAAATALIFACHPALSEAVAGIAGRADLLAVFFGLAALLAHTRPDRGKATGLWVATLFGVALLCKESAVVLLGLLPLTDVIQYRLFSRKIHWIPHLAYAATLGVYLVWRYYILGALTLSDVDMLDNPLVSLSPHLQTANALALLWRYIGLLLLPWHLSADYSFAALPLSAHISDPALISPILATAALAFAIIRWWRSAPLPAFGLVWFFIGIAPVANVLFPIGTVMAERLLYLPAIGFALLLAWGLAQLSRSFSERVAITALILLLASYAERTHRRNLDWQNEYTLFSSAVHTQPNSARAWRGLGNAAAAKSPKEALALSAWHRALEIYPAYYEVHNDLGAFYYAQDDIQAAHRQWETCIEQGPAYAPCWFNAGLARYRLGRQDDAIAALQRALTLDPGYIAAYYNLGVMLLEKGAYQQSIDHFGQALRLQPGHQDAQANLAAARQMLARKIKSPVLDKSGTRD
jgi:protein O-mannosyl-transferase